MCAIKHVMINIDLNDIFHPQFKTHSHRLRKPTWTSQMNCVGPGLTEASLYTLRRPMTRNHRHESDDFNLELVAFRLCHCWSLMKEVSSCLQPHESCCSCGMLWRVSVVRGSCELRKGPASKVEFEAKFCRKLSSFLVFQPQMKD